MNNELPIKVEKQSIFRKIISFLKGIFSKKEKFQDVYNVECNSSQEENFKKQYQTESKELKIADKVKPLSSIERIIQIIEKEPKTLKKLDVKKLKVIENYYIEQIAEYKRKIASM